MRLDEIQPNASERRTQRLMASARAAGDCAALLKAQAEDGANKSRAEQAPDTRRRRKALKPIRPTGPAPQN